MDKVKVKNCLAIAFGIEVDKITDESSQLNLPEWDSLKHLNMIVELEVSFEIFRKRTIIVVVISCPPQG